MAEYHPRGSRVHELVWRALQPYMPPGTQITYAYRSRQEQLDLIVARAKRAGMTFQKEPSVGDSRSWYAAWKVANRDPKYPIAQPGRSAHERQIAFDLLGPRLEAIEKGIKNAVAAGRISLCPSRGHFSNPKVEGGCVHVEIDRAWLYDNDDFEVA